MKLMRGRLVEFLILLMVALGAGPVGAAFWQWSTNANLNASADPTINWAEGMAPSSVNDSARAMMAALAVNAGDRSGSITTGGSGGAYTLGTGTAYPNFTAISNQPISFIANVVNLAGATINIDGLGALPITVATSTPIPANTMKAGGIYTVTKLGSEYRLHNQVTGAYQVPLGTVLWSTISTPPDGNYLAADGRCVSTTTYATYWVAVGSPPSTGCAGGFFTLTDLRGRVPAGLDTMPVVGTAGRMTSSATGCGTVMNVIGAVCANGVESYALSTAMVPNLNVSVSGNVTTANLLSADSPTTSFSTSTSGATVWRAFSNGSTQTIISSVGISGAGATTNGGGGLHPVIPPTIGLMPYIRVL